jgi:hypothetical protein
MLKKIGLIFTAFIITGCQFITEDRIIFSDYFPTNPGYYLQYSLSINSNVGDNGGFRYITFQNPTESDEPVFMYSSDAWDTTGLIDEIEFGNIICNKTDNFLISGYESSGYGFYTAFNYFVRLLKEGNIGDTYKVQGINYKIDYTGTFPEYNNGNCVNITFDATSQEVEEGYHGIGSFTLVKNIGIVFLEFQQSEDGIIGTSGSRCTYLLDYTRQINERTIKGKIISNNYPIWLAISNCSSNSRYLSYKITNSEPFEFSIFYNREHSSIQYCIGEENGITSDLDNTTMKFQELFWFLPDKDIDIGEIHF